MSQNHGTPEIKTPSWERYYLNIAKEVARKCKCYRAMYGAVIVKNDEIISAGYVGAPRKTKDCLERGNCLRNELNVPRGQRYELCRSVHSEQNAIINAARAGVSVLGGDLYLYGEGIEKDGTRKLLNIMPCSFCKRMIINAGLQRVIGSNKDGGINIYHVEDWVRDWQAGDIVDDVLQHGEGLKVYKPGEDPVEKKLNNEQKDKQLIIGITGTLGAGKGAIVAYLKQKGFKHYSARAFIVEEIKKRNLPVNRDTMVEVGNALRAEYSVSYIAEELFKRAKQAGGACVIESIRTAGEVEALREKGSFYLFAIDTDAQKRYERVIERQSSTDKISFDEFIANEKREMQSDDPNKQNLSQCIEMADFKFNNSGTFSDLYKKVDAVLEKLKS